MAGRRSQVLGKWLAFLAGPLVWAGHFAAVYAAPSLEITLTGEAGIASTIFIVVVTLVSFGSLVWKGLRLWRGTDPRWETPQEDLTGLWRKAGALLAYLSAVAILYQGLPPLFVTGDALSHSALPGIAPAELDIP